MKLLAQFLFGLAVIAFSLVLLLSKTMLPEIPNWGCWVGIAIGAMIVADFAFEASGHGVKDDDFDDENFNPI